MPAAIPAATRTLAEVLHDLGGIPPRRVSPAHKVFRAIQETQMELAA